MILNHGQSLFSWIDDWFKPLAYSIIMLRQEGLPCVFYGDYYGIPYSDVEPKKDFIDLLLHIRKNYIYGTKRDYFDDPNIIGWTLEGDIVHENSGAAIILTDSCGGSKAMNVGYNLANSVLYDCTGNNKETVYIDQDGNGIFYVNDKSVSIWIKKEDKL